MDKQAVVIAGDRWPDQWQSIELGRNIAISIISPGGEEGAVAPPPPPTHSITMFD